MRRSATIPSMLVWFSKVREQLIHWLAPCACIIKVSRNRIPVQPLCHIDDTLNWLSCTSDYPSKIKDPTCGGGQCVFVYHIVDSYSLSVTSTNQSLWAGRSCIRWLHHPSIVEEECLIHNLRLGIHSSSLPLCSLCKPYILTCHCQPNTNGRLAVSGECIGILWVALFEDSLRTPVCFLNSWTWTWIIQLTEAFF